eukprot:m.193187 g.193187  ORF g.193187 m.193187 type:complete len:963 (+) comp16976_c0_seq1:3-2891(+)
MVFRAGIVMAVALRPMLLAIALTKCAQGRTPTSEAEYMAGFFDSDIPLNGLLYADAAYSYNATSGDWDCPACKLITPAPLKHTVIDRRGTTTDSFRAIVSATSDQLVISIRGTCQAGNWVENLQASYARFGPTFLRSYTCHDFPLSDGHVQANLPILPCVHSGFYDVYKRLQTNISSEIRSMMTDSIKTVLIVGHSLGGAVATILLADLLLPGRQEFIHRRDVNVYLITFGAPKVGNAVFKRDMALQLNAAHATIRSWRVTNYRDPVPSVDFKLHMDRGIMYTFRGANTPPSVRVCKRTHFEDSIDPDCDGQLATLTPRASHSITYGARSYLNNMYDRWKDKPTACEFQGLLDNEASCLATAVEFRRSLPIEHAASETCVLGMDCLAKAGDQSLARLLSSDDAKSRQRRSAVDLLESTSKLANGLLQLSSKPSYRSSNIIYLDFDGHTYEPPESDDDSEPVDEAYRPFNAPPMEFAYSPDDTSDTFNHYEQALIYDIWERVSEDFAPWRVDVTTIAPTAPALKKRTTSHVVITRLVRYMTSSLCPCGTKGCSKFNSFGGTSPDPAPPVLILSDLQVHSSQDLANEISRQIGFQMGLPFYSGADSNTFFPGLPATKREGYDWAPIMGFFPRSLGYGVRHVTQWANGAALGDPGSRDDIQQISDKLGLYVSDEAGDFIASATLLRLNANGDLNISGVITPGDVDVYEVQAFQDGQYTFSVTPKSATFRGYGDLSLGRSLDVKVEILQSNGVLLRSADTSASTSAIFEMNTATPFAKERIAYFVRISGVKGRFSPSAYGSIGSYTLSVTEDGRSECESVYHNFAQKPPFSDYFGPIIPCPGSDGLEPDNIIANTKELLMPQTVGPLTICPGDIDILKMTPCPGANGLEPLSISRPKMARNLPSLCGCFERPHRLPTELAFQRNPTRVLEYTILFTYPACRSHQRNHSSLSTALEVSPATLLSSST